MAGDSPLSFGATTSLSATSTTGRAALPTLNSNQLVITNLGPDLAYVTLGGSTVVATSTTGYPLMPGAQIAVTINPTITSGAALTATTTATILFTAADGIISGIAASSTGAGGGGLPTGAATSANQTNGNQQVQGNVATGATDSGNPLKIGGVFNTVPPTLTNAQRGDAQLDNRGSLWVQFGNSSQSAGIQAQNTDGLSSAVNGLISSANAHLYNGTTWDRSRSGGVTGMVGVNPQATPSGGATFTHIVAGQATTTIKSGSGTLYAIILNGAGTATNVTTIFDSTTGTGTVIGIPTTTGTLVPNTINYGTVGVAFSTGLTILTATANGPDMTVIWK